MQQKMMKYMMVFMGLMFYKVPSGLVLYFIASSIWGFCERKLLPKKKKPAADGTVAAAPPSFLQNLLNKPAAKDSTGVTTAPFDGAVSNGSPRTEGKGRNRGKQGKNKPQERARPDQRAGIESRRERFAVATAAQLVARPPGAHERGLGKASGRGPEEEPLTAA